MTDTQLKNMANMVVTGVTQPVKLTAEIKMKQTNKNQVGNFSRLAPIWFGD